MEKIFIYSGEIKTGKTTRLMQWALAQKNIDGIFQPVVEGKRFIYHIGTKTLRQLEVAGSTDTVKIGKYNFSGDVLLWARNVLSACFYKRLDWLIIDEIGPLELNGKGLEPVASQIIEDRHSFAGNILCVVRSTMFEMFVRHYRLENSYEVFTLE